MGVSFCCHRHFQLLERSIPSQPGQVSPEQILPSLTRGSCSPLVLGAFQLQVFVFQDKLAGVPTGTACALHVQAQWGGARALQASAENSTLLQPAKELRHRELEGCNQDSPKLSDRRSTVLKTIQISKVCSRQSYRGNQSHQTLQFRHLPANPLQLCDNCH